MGTVNRNAHAGHRGLEVGQVHDAATLIFHLHFLLRVAGVQKGIDLRDDIERDLVRENFLHDGAPFGEVFGLMPELVDGSGAGSRNSLVAGGEKAGHAEGAVQWVKRHEGDGCCAVWIGNDATVVFDIRPIDFGNDKRHIVRHAEGGGIVHHHRATGHGRVGEVARDRSASAEERNIDAFERIQMQWLHRDFLATEGEGFSSGAGGCQQAEAGYGEVAAFHDAEHFHSDCAGSANDCDSMGF